MVGFIMYGLDPDDNEYWISRLLIDEKFQKRGYGKEAMKQILILINETYQPQKLLLSVEPENVVAEKLSVVIRAEREWGQLSFSSTIGRPIRIARFDENHVAFLSIVKQL